jgi:hypothetical protein
VPLPVPARLFWLVTVYDAETRSQVQTDQGRPVLSSPVRLPRHRPLSSVVGATVEASAPPPHLPTGPGMDRSSALRQLKDLGELKASRVLSEEEFSQQKALILGG